MIKNNDKLKVSDITANIYLSKQTICRRLKEKNYIYGNYHKKPLLTEKQKLTRLLWAKEHLNLNWSYVIFSDEMSIWMNKHMGKYWYEIGQ